MTTTTPTPTQPESQSGRPRTLGELRASGYQSESVKSEMRRNLIARLKDPDTRDGKTPLFPGILGYEETVIPQIVNAILSKHDMLFLGLRGQAKTRMLRQLVSLLDESLPIVEGSEIFDDPYHPISLPARDLVRLMGDATPIAWVGREQRYQEKLATPDVTIADLIGEIDMIKHAEGKYLSSELTMHFGLIPRTNRGIFCINELPDLSPKIQVGLFNVLEERDIQIRGYPVRLNLDVCVVFSANPEDYTNRGRIVTPLKDRIGSVIRTHYPLTRDLGVAVTDDNAWIVRDGLRFYTPYYIKEIVEETARLARTSSHVNQQSGVSVRMSIANLENVVSNAERRALGNNETLVLPRIGDLCSMSAGSRGKIELVMTEDEGAEDKLMGRIIEEAVKNVFDHYAEVKSFRSLVEYFDGHEGLELSDSFSTDAMKSRMEKVPNLFKLAGDLSKKLMPELQAQPQDQSAALVAAAEFVLEGLHVHNRLNKNGKDGQTRYQR